MMVFRRLLKKPKNRMNYLNPDIPNELINFIARKIESKLSELSEIEETAFITNIMQDLSKIDQLNIVFHYILIKKYENKKPTEL